VYIADFGIRQMPADTRDVAANVALGQDVLPSVAGLSDYVAKQVSLITQHLANAKTAGPKPTPFEGVEEALLLFVRHSPANAPEMLHVQTYVRVGLWVGIITLTTPEAQLIAVRADYEAFVKGLRIVPEPGQAGAGS
jgi:hypothetical protein